MSQTTFPLVTSRRTPYDPRLVRALLALSALALSACCVTGRDSDEGLIPPPPGQQGSASVPAAVAPVRTVAAATVTAPKPGTPPPVVGETWGGTAIAWRTPAEGFAEAKQSGKPVMLVLFTTWCPHCKNFSKMFDDPRIAEAAKGLIMVRVDADKDEATSTKYQPDGGYIPRTFFLKSDASLVTTIKANDGKYGYFYDERDPAPLLASMARAKKEIVR